jgi:hypothetical protein
MKSQFVRMALLSAVVLTSPLLTFAGGQPAKMHKYSKEDAQDRTGITRAIQQGKGSGMSLSDGTIRANAYREQTTEQRPVATVQPIAGHVKSGDPAFTK